MFLFNHGTEKVKSVAKSIGQKVKRRYVVPDEAEEHNKIEKKVFKLRNK
jgi:hypothetical protein